jgi:hypothetical protein
MNKKQAHAKTDDRILRPPAFPMAGNRILEKAAASIGASRGYLLHNIDVAQIVGRSKSTTSFWLGVYDHPHLVSLICLLEHLPQQDRYRLIDELCRELPLLDHPRLRHNPYTVGMLKNLLKQETGLSLLVGGSHAQRAFVLGALGHTFCRVDHIHRMPGGLDIYGPGNLVPVETMLYLRSPIGLRNPDRLISRLFSEVVHSTHPLLLLHGVWSLAPELQTEILMLAKRRHIVVCEQQVSFNATADSESKYPLHVLSVSTSRDSSSWISVEVKPG